MRTRSGADAPMKWRRRGSSLGGAELAAGVILGELLGALIGLVGTPRHVPTTTTTEARYERPASEMDEHNDIARALLGAATGALGGAAAVALHQGIRRLRACG